MRIISQSFNLIIILIDQLVHSLILWSLYYNEWSPYHLEVSVRHFPNTLVAPSYHFFVFFLLVIIVHNLNCILWYFHRSTTGKFLKSSDCYPCRLWYPRSLSYIIYRISIWRYDHFIVSTFVRNDECYKYIRKRSFLLRTWNFYVDISRLTLTLLKNLCTSGKIVSVSSSGINEYLGVFDAINIIQCV